MTSEAGKALEPFRNHLQVLAELHLDRRLRGKLDPSDIVQQTMLRACSAIVDFSRERTDHLSGGSAEGLLSGSPDCFASSFYARPGPYGFGT